MSDISHQAAKADLRRAILAARRERGPQLRASAAARVQVELAAWVRATRPAVVTGYVPVGTEPGGAALPAALAAALPPAGWLLLPVLLADLDIDWARYTGPDALAPVGRGLHEPTGPRLGPGAVTAADLVVVPALAVDRRGVRLGRGGGSYDRVLARVRPDTLVAAVLYDGEQIEHLPAEPHDRRVGAVVTPSGGLTLLGATG